MTTEQLNFLIDSCGTQLYSFCCHLTGNRTDADDLYQDVFLLFSMAEELLAQ